VLPQERVGQFPPGPEEAPNTEESLSFLSKHAQLSGSMKRDETRSRSLVQ
jgi:hypothetical protein